MDINLTDLNQKETINIHIIYHYPCIDGGLSCYILQVLLNKVNSLSNNFNLAFFYYPSRSFDDIKIPFKQIQTVDKNNFVFILDKSCSEDDLQFLINTTEENKYSMVIIDHHETFVLSNKVFNLENNLNKILEIFISLSKSTSLESLNNYFGKVFTYINEDSTISAAFQMYLLYSKFGLDFENDFIKIIKAVSDQDVGKVDLVSSCIKSGLCEFFKPKEKKLFFKTKDNVINTFSNLDYRFLYITGEKHLKLVKKETILEIKQKKFLLFNMLHNEEKLKFIICVTNKKYLRNFMAPIIEKINLINGYVPIGGVAYPNGSLIRVSLRKTYGDTSFNLAEICQSYSGGGHKGAAAFSVTNEIFKKMTTYDTKVVKVPSDLNCFFNF